ncbi:MAG TPA: hypothetical protein VKJ65_03480 [Phycisphaerae bacterium]|nr:hypothetical protein [Phycisphaerae bacterium]
MATEKPTYSPLTFLIVHDNPEDLYMLVKVFQEARIWNKLYVLRRGLDVLPFLNKLPPFQNKRTPDVIFLKQNMPDLPSQKIVDQVSADPRFSEIKFAMLMNNSDDSDDQAFSVDAEIILNMPVKPEKLLEVVRSLGKLWCTFAKVEIPAEPSPPQHAESSNNACAESSLMGIPAITQ